MVLSPYILGGLEAWFFICRFQIQPDINTLIHLATWPLFRWINQDRHISGADYLSTLFYLTLALILNDGCSQARSSGCSKRFILYRGVTYSIRTKTPPYLCHRCCTNPGRIRTSFQSQIPFGNPNSDPQLAERLAEPFHRIPFYQYVNLRAAKLFEWVTVLSSNPFIDIIS